MGTQPIGDLTERDVITMMLGRELQDHEVHKAETPTSQPALQTQGLTARGGLGPLSFDVHYGEVLGVAGLVGSGRSGLCVRSSGSSSPTPAKRSVIDGRSVRLPDPTAALREGIIMLPEDRKAEGIFPDLDVRENLVVTRSRAAEPGVPAGRPRYQGRAIRVGTGAAAIRGASPLTETADLDPERRQPAESDPYGGALVEDARILLLNEPTRGVDVGTKVENHELVRDLAREGNAVVVKLIRRTRGGTG